MKFSMKTVRIKNSIYAFINLQEIRIGKRYLILKQNCNSYKSIEKYIFAL